VETGQIDRHSRLPIRLVLRH